MKQVDPNELRKQIVAAPTDELITQHFMLEIKPYMKRGYWNIFEGALRTAMLFVRHEWPGMTAPPIPMILHCPKCGAQHVDKPESDLDYQKRIGEFDRVGASYAEPRAQIPPPRWTNPPHRSHTCHGCQTTWRPADVPTVGVEFIETCGKIDSISYVKHFINGTELVQPPTLVNGGYAVSKSKRSGAQS